MKYTTEDIQLFKELLKVAKDDICYSTPSTLTSKDIDRLCSLGFCSVMPNGLIVLAYDKFTFSEIEDRFQQAQYQRAKQEAEKASEKAEERAYLDKQTQKQFRHDWRITLVGCAINFALGAILDHFFDIVSYAADLWRSLFH